MIPETQAQRPTVPFTFILATHNTKEEKAKQNDPKRKSESETGKIESREDRLGKTD